MERSKSSVIVVIKKKKYYVSDFVEVLQANSIMKRNCTSEASQFKTLSVTRPSEYVVQVELNRPEKLNAMNTDFWRYMNVKCLQQY